ncbi:MAG: DEAD/DEAH box helicase [Thermoplasmatota archaeon]
MFVAHDLLREGRVARRDYQVAIAAECVRRNTLVILPTGLGKTVVAVLAIAERVAKVPGKILFLAPTKPLVEQHAKFLREATSLEPIHVFTGETAPEERELLWKEAAALCATPQVIQNDVISGRIDLADVTLLVVDEAHRATGDYPYVFLAEQYRRHRPKGLLLAMTASPGADPARVRAVCEALGIEGVEIRTPFDADTAPYLQSVAIERIEVSIPETLRATSALLRQLLDERVAFLRERGVIQGRFASKRELLAAQGRLQAMLREQGRAAPRELYDALSAQAAALKLTHGLELVETQGVAAFDAYAERLTVDESRAARAIVADPRFSQARITLSQARMEHPKMRKVLFLLREQLEKNPKSKVIVFTNYRDIADQLSQALANADERLKPVRFVGQQTKGADKGLSQRKQVDLLDQFRAGSFNVLVATSVAEEGLDIPTTDLVIFYEPVASEIRSIQRRGRTGRNAPGRVVVLVTKGTSDESMLWASFGREKKMRREIEALRAQLGQVARVNESESHPARPLAAFAAAAQGPANGPSSAPAQAGSPSAASPLAAVDGSAEAGVVAPSANATPSSGASGSWMQSALTATKASRPVEARLDAFAETKTRPAIVLDSRELQGAVARALASLDVQIKVETLDIADYVLSDRVAVERKTTADFEASLMDGRLFTQVRALKESYLAPILLLEGGAGDVHIGSDAAMGAIAALAADFRLPVVTTRDAAETARFLATVAKREQITERRPLSIRHGKGTMTDDDRLRFLVEGLPDVSAVLARRLLAHFGTVQAIANADEDALAEVEGIGKQKASAIARIVRARFGVHDRAHEDAVASRAPTRGLRVRPPAAEPQADATDPEDAA